MTSKMKRDIESKTTSKIKIKPKMKIPTRVKMDPNRPFSFFTVITHYHRKFLIKDP